MTSTHADAPLSVLVVGARTGVVPLLIAHLFRFHVRVTALEPHADRFAVAEANLQRLADGGVVTCVHALLATEAAAGVRRGGAVALASAAGGDAHGETVIGGGHAWQGVLTERLRGTGALSETAPAITLSSLQVCGKPTVLLHRCSAPLRWHLMTWCDASGNLNSFLAMSESDVDNSG